MPYFIPGEAVKNQKTPWVEKDAWGKIRLWFSDIDSFNPKPNTRLFIPETVIKKIKENKRSIIITVNDVSEVQYAGVDD